MLGDDHAATAWTMHSLAHTLVTNAGKDGIPAADDREIESLYRHALAIFRNMRGDNWQTYDITLKLGQFFSSRHRYEEAESVLQDGVLRLHALPAAPLEITAGLTGELESLYQSWASRRERRNGSGDFQRRNPRRKSHKSKTSEEIKAAGEAYRQASSSPARHLLGAGTVLKAMTF